MLIKTFCREMMDKLRHAELCEILLLLFLMVVGIPMMIFMSGILYVMFASFSCK
jgi:hypothetical protein